MTSNRRIAKSMFIGAVLALWVILLGTAMVWGLQNEQNDIRNRVHGALFSEGLRLDILVEGRDVTLSGAANDDERARAESIVRALEGVRSISWNDLPPIIIDSMAKPPAEFQPALQGGV